MNYHHVLSGLHPGAGRGGGCVVLSSGIQWDVVRMDHDRPCNKVLSSSECKSLQGICRWTILIISSKLIGRPDGRFPRKQSRNQNSHSVSSPSHPLPDTVNYDSAKPLPRTVRPASLTRFLVIYLSHSNLPRLQPSSSSPARSLHWITRRSDGCTFNATTSSSVDVLHAPCSYLLATEEHVEVFKMTVFVSVSLRAHRN